MRNKTGRQVTDHAIITNATLTALADLLHPGQDGHHGTAAPVPASNKHVGIAAAAYYRLVGATIGPGPSP